MSAQQPKTIGCPSCGNINSYSADECMRCGFALGPIREVMAKAGAAQQTDAAESSPKSAEAPTVSEPKTPAPPLPNLPQRPTTKQIGNYVDSQQVLVRGMGDRAELVAEWFFERLSARGIQGVSLGIGSRIVNDAGRSDSRTYYFAERDLGKGALATMAVRIAPVGTDLFIEWRHYVTFSKRDNLGLVGTIVVFSTLVGIALLVVKPFREWVYSLDAPNQLQGFQTQDSTAFQLGVRLALEEAIDKAGISKLLIQSVSKEGGKDRRLI